MQISDKMYRQMIKAMRAIKKENKNLRKGMGAGIRIHWKLCRLVKQQTYEIEELKRRPDISSVLEMEDSLEKLINGTEVLLSETAAMDAHIKDLEAEKSILFQTNEKLLAAVSNQRVEINQLSAENEQLWKCNENLTAIISNQERMVAQLDQEKNELKYEMEKTAKTTDRIEIDHLRSNNQQLLRTISNQKMMISQLNQEKTVLENKMEKILRTGSWNLATQGLRAENDQLKETNGKLFSTVTNHEMTIFKSDQENHKLRNQFRAEAEEQIGIVNGLKKQLTSKVADYELEIDAWNRDETKMLEELDAKNKRVAALEEEVQCWRTGYYRLCPPEPESEDEEEDTCSADDEISSADDEDDCDSWGPSAAKKMKLSE